MELIDAYVQEVGRRLPANDRADLEQEIRTMVEDTLDDESRKQGRPVDEDMVVEVLKRLGSPEKMASSYLPPRYLIGPELYPAFIRTLQIVAGVIVALGIIGMGVSIGLSTSVPAEVAHAIWQAAAGLLSSLIQAFGIIALIFAIMQRFSLKAIADIQTKWDPRKLHVQPTPDKEKINPAGLVVEIAMTIVALALFNLFPQWIGIANLRSGQWVIVSVLSQAFFDYLPWLSMIWALTAAVKVVVLVQGRWTVWTRSASLVMIALSVGITYRMLIGPDLLAFPPDMIQQLGMGNASPQTIQQLATLSNTGLKIALAFGVLGGIVDLVKGVYHLVMNSLVPAASHS